HVRDRQARLVADLGHVVLELGLARSGVKPPPEERAPELSALRGVVRRDLEMHYLTWHSAPVVSLFGEKPWPRRGWSMRPVPRADLIAVAHDLTSCLPEYPTASLRSPIS